MVREPSDVILRVQPPRAQKDGEWRDERVGWMANVLYFPLTSSELLVHHQLLSESL